ncbi:MAG: YkgJ family cysteine cluster protein [Campylobacterota bacterium]|nr:YkgJ family cysteine cluster protein [Campylobacterota bacterium]
MLEHKEYNYKFDETICSSCDGNCCIGESGYIWINKEEILRLSKHLNITIEELKMKYLFKLGYQYSINEKQISKNNYACIFFDMDKKQCSIYEARPKQCRTFPFWDYFKNKIEEVKKECPAIVD